MIIMSSFSKRKDVRLNKALQRLCCFVLVFLVLAFSNLPKAQAYNFNGFVLSNPTNISYSISSTVGGYISGMSNFVEIWSGFCSEVSFAQQAWTGTENIGIYGNLNLSNGTYAICAHANNNRHVITLFNDYTQATSVEQHETIVHEVGHALGSAHCQPAQESKSVMRANDFNNKPYPLSDDRAGISALYGY